MTSGDNASIGRDRDAKTGGVRAVDWFLVGAPESCAGDAIIGDNREERIDPDISLTGDIDVSGVNHQVEGGNTLRCGYEPFARAGCSVVERRDPLGSADGVAGNCHLALVRAEGEWRGDVVGEKPGVNELRPEQGTGRTLLVELDILAVAEGVEGEISVPAGIDE